MAVAPGRAYPGAVKAPVPAVYPPLPKANISRATNDVSMNRTATVESSLPTWAQASMSNDPIFSAYRERSEDSSAATAVRSPYSDALTTRRNYHENSHPRGDSFDSLTARSNDVQPPKTYFESPVPLNAQSSQAQTPSRARAEVNTERTVKSYREKPLPVISNKTNEYTVLPRNSDLANVNSSSEVSQPNSKIAYPGASTTFSQHATFNDTILANAALSRDSTRASFHRVTTEMSSGTTANKSVSKSVRFETNEFSQPKSSIVPFVNPAPAAPFAFAQPSTSNQATPTNTSTNLIQDSIRESFKNVASGTFPAKFPLVTSLDLDFKPKTQNTDVNAPVSSYSIGGPAQSQLQNLDHSNVTVQTIKQTSAPTNSTSDNISSLGVQPDSKECRVGSIELAIDALGQYANTLTSASISTSDPKSASTSASNSISGTDTTSTAINSSSSTGTTTTIAATTNSAATIPQQVVQLLLVVFSYF